MKRIMSVLSAMLIALVGVPSAANAGQAGTVAADNCNHANGEIGTIVSASYVRRSSDNGEIGSVQLCKDSESNYWGYIIFYSPLETGTWGNVYLNRFWDGQRIADYNCDDAPIKHVRPGERRCWTPKIFGDNYRYTFQAVGIKHRGDTRIAFGATAKTR